MSVLVADDHALVRESLAHWLSAETDLEVMHIVATADDAVREAARSPPDVVVFDIDMPGKNAFEAVREIKRACRRTAALFLSAFFHDLYIEQALAVEASGYLTKAESPQSIANAVRTVANGGIYFSPEILARLVVASDGVRLASSARSRASTLTPREREVLRHVADGLAKKEISELMHISIKTVDRHCTNLMEKLDIHNRVQLARFAIREGLAQP